MPPERAYTFDAYTLPEENQRQLKIYKKKKKKSRYLKTEKTTTRMLMFILVVMVFTVLIRYTVISDMNAKNESLQKELVSLNAENQQLDVYLESTTDLGVVEKTAKEKLGMRKPDDNQVVQITLDMSNRSVKTQKKENGFIKGVKNAASFVMEYLY